MKSTNPNSAQGNKIVQRKRSERERLKELTDAENKLAKDMLKKIESSGRQKAEAQDALQVKIANMQAKREAKKQFSYKSGKIKAHQKSAKREPGIGGEELSRLRVIGNKPRKEQGDMDRLHPPLDSTRNSLRRFDKFEVTDILQTNNRNKQTLDKTVGPETKSGISTKGDSSNTDKVKSSVAEVLAESSSSQKLSEHARMAFEGTLSAMLVNFLNEVPPTERKVTMFRIANRVLERANRDVDRLRHEMLNAITQKQIPTWAVRDKSQTARQFLEENWGKYLNAGILSASILRDYDLGFMSYITKYAKDVLPLIPSISAQNKTEIDALTVLGYSARELVRLAAKAQQEQ